MDRAYISKLVDIALKEDEARADITSRLTIPAGRKVKAVIFSRQVGVLAGIPLAVAVFKQLDKTLRVKLLAKDGGKVRAGGRVLAVEGKARSIFAAERIALNFLGYLSGIATLTGEYVRRAGRMKVYDTRKTHAGLRAAEKYSVRMGGGYNHRLSLADGVMLKDNHRVLNSNLAEVVRNSKFKIKNSKQVIVEVESLQEALAAAGAGADLLLLDNMTPVGVKRIAKALKGRIPLEVSGGVTLSNIGKYAKSGADRVSIGRITHSAPSLDLSLEVIENGS